MAGTNRDRIWTAVLELAAHPGFTIHDVREQIDGEVPTDRCIQQTLASMEELGVLDGRGGESSDPRKYCLGERPREAIHDLTLYDIDEQPIRDSFTPTERVKFIDMIMEGLDPYSLDALEHFEGGLLCGEGTVKDEEGNIVCIEDGF